MRGAEAKVNRTKIIGISAVCKSRIQKKYRVVELDRKLRIERTRSEAKLLHKAKLAGVDCPTVLEVSDFELIISFVDGKRPKMDEEEAKEAGEILAKLHSADIIHGDYTPANLIKTKIGLSVIDFGLGFISNDVEDKAVDVFTMLRAIGKGNKNGTDAFLAGYSNYAKSAEVMKRVAVVEKRVRYAV
jgi:Kae1-associated kinase Bud32